jgi:hypothetical protein
MLPEHSIESFAPPAPLGNRLSTLCLELAVPGSVRDEGLVLGMAKSNPQRASERLSGVSCPAQLGTVTAARKAAITYADHRGISTATFSFKT